MRSALLFATVAAAAGVAAHAADAPLHLSVQDAVLSAIERNPSLRVQRLQPQLARTREDAARAAFDPTVSGTLSRGWQDAPRSVLQGDASGGISEDDARRETTDAAVAVETLLPAGTRIAAGGRTTVQDKPADTASSRVGVEVEQPLLAGRGSAANLAVLRQARLDVRISAFELRGYVLALVAEVERACWAYVESQHARAALRDALQIAERQAEETGERIRVGKLAELESVAARAEVASRREGLINAESACEAGRLRLVRLLNPARADAWDAAPVILDEPVPPEAPPGRIEDFVGSALARRPDLNQVRLLQERGELEVVRTRNGLLPRLDLFASLGRSGYAGSFVDSIGDREGDGTDAAVGLRLEYPLFRRAARADHRRAVLTRRQADEAFTNLCHLAQEDVRLAWVEAERARAQVAASAATLTLQERKLEAERIKFREGKSTALLVGQAERDLLQSRLAHLRAVSAALIARTELYLQDGSLLDRRGIAVLDED